MDASVVPTVLERFGGRVEVLNGIPSCIALITNGTRNILHALAHHLRRFKKSWVSVHPIYLLTGVIVPYIISYMFSIRQGFLFLLANPFPLTTINQWDNYFKLVIMKIFAGLIRNYFGHCSCFTSLAGLCFWDFTSSKIICLFYHACYRKCFGGLKWPFRLLLNAR